MDMTEHRQRRIADLRAEAERNRDRAAALDFLSRRIRTAAIPVERWRPYWQAVAEEAQRMARNAVTVAREADQRAETMEVHTTAHADWQQPTRQLTLTDAVRGLDDVFADDGHTDAG